MTIVEDLKGLEVRWKLSMIECTIAIGVSLSSGMRCCMGLGLVEEGVLHSFVNGGMMGLSLVGNGGRTGKMGESSGGGETRGDVLSSGMRCI